MNAVLLWKEYRQQRALWLAILVLALVLGESLAAVFHHAEWEQVAPTVALFCLALTYGIVSGALLLATEKEEGTLAFLDTLTGRRTALWRSKVLAGVVLTGAQGAALAWLAVLLRLASWEVVVWLPLAALDALVWGLLGGALCASGLTAVLAGILLMAASWGLALPLADTPAVIPIEAGLVLAALVTSWRLFCGPDLTRRVRRAAVWSLPLPRFLAPGRALLWLAFRQGRRALALGVVGALLLGLALNYEPLLLWPLGTLVLGLICGLAVFVSDQQGGAAFFAAQRFPPRQIWIWKIGFWAAALCVMLALAWYTGTGLVWTLSLPLHAEVSPVEATGHFGQVDYWLDRWLFIQGLDVDRRATLLLGLWPVYGFCVGQFFGLAARRSLHAVVLGVAFAGVCTALWAPSLLIGGIPSWLPLLLAGLLLAASWLTIRPWIANRLWTPRPVLSVTSLLLLLAVGIGATLWYRTVQVPDVGEPFDERAFLASFPPPEKNESGRRLHHAADLLAAHVKEVNDRLGAPKETTFPAQPFLANGMAANQTTYAGLLPAILERGWPVQDTEVARWLDEIFEDEWATEARQAEWATEARQAARMPLGVVVGPSVDSQRPLYELSDRLEQMARLFVARALQRQAHGTARDGLDDLDTALRLVRQVQNRSPLILFAAGRTMNEAAVDGFRHWLLKASADRALLREALGIVQQQTDNPPDLVDALKVQLLIEHDQERSRPTLVDSRTIRNIAYQLAYEAPWEHERQERIRNAIGAGELRAVQLPLDSALPLPSPRGYYLYRAALANLPPPQGPGSTRSAEQWGEFISQELRPSWGLGHTLQTYARQSQRSLRLTELAIAICLYQVDHGSAPPTLAALVPNYLSAVPVDAFHGRPFGYRISQGEVLEEPTDNQSIHPTPGQAVLEALSGTQMTYYLVPPPKK